MQQKFGLFSFSLLMFSIVLCVAISLDPKGFALKEWQTVMASLIAFAGATFVYRGATLAYHAAMAKVALDEKIHDAVVSRQRRGVYLRLHQICWALSQDANRRATRLAVPEIGSKSVPAEVLALPPTSIDISEAWAALDAFPHRVALPIANLKIYFSNVENHLKAIAGAPIVLQAGKEKPTRAVRLEKQYNEIASACEVIRSFLEEELGMPTQTSE